VALFSEMLYRFPNVVVAHVTRESVQQAIANGITAQQVREARPVGGGGCSSQNSLFMCWYWASGGMFTTCEEYVKHIRYTPQNS